GFDQEQILIRFFYDFCGTLWSCSWRHRSQCRRLERMASQRLFDLRKQQRLPRRTTKASNSSLSVWIGSYILISLFPFFILF
ncbi:unnamed protein product, partial [Brassica rapa subsp. trilocularis]